MEPQGYGKYFVWIVSPTAIYRPDWKYSPSDHYIHLLPNFWSNPRWATFARPRWCGLHESIWWPYSIESIPTKSLRSYLKDKTNYKYTLRIYDENNNLQPVKPQIIYVQPQLPQLIPGPKELFELYECGLEVSLYIPETLGLYTELETYSLLTNLLRSIGRINTDDSQFDELSRTSRGILIPCNDSSCSVELLQARS